LTFYIFRGVVKH